MGFNLGATKLRQRWTGDVERHVFESPLIRLMKDHHYSDIYEHGTEVTTGRPVPARSIWIYRYYEPVSKHLGTGERPEIEDYAEGLHQSIERIRAQVCGDSAGSSDDFRVYLVAHSMGGLIVRCYLQNICPKLGIKPPVDKVFTYATPHGGIDFRVIGNVPKFLTKNNIDNFNESRMRAYLKLPDGEPVNSLGDKFDPQRFFCLVGTNARDYAVAMGLSSFGTGPMGDGLVQINNAYVQGAPRAFVYRSHSGHFGIVNSEEGYQNLKRFLFGKVRVDGYLDVDDVRLHPKVEKARLEGKAIGASYHIEVIAGVRKGTWDLPRRVADENSAIFLKYQDIKQRQETNRPIQLLSAFLEKNTSDAVRRTLGFSIDLRVLVPEYEVERAWLPDLHYEGGHLFRDKINLEVTIGGNKPPALKYGFDRKTPNQIRYTATGDQEKILDNGQYEYTIPIEQDTHPGLIGSLILRAQPWR